MTLPARLVEGLNRVCRTEGATLFMGLVAALDVVLGRYANTDDVLVGTFVAGRGQAELERLVGFFVNTVVLRVDLGGRPSFRTVVGRTRDSALGAFAHGELPFDRVVEELAPAREPGVIPYVQVAVVMQNMPAEATRVGDLFVETLPGDSRAAAFDLSIHVYQEEDGGLGGFIEYATDLWQASTVDRLVDHLVVVLEQAVAHPERPIDALALSGPAHDRGPDADFGDASVAGRFDTLAASTPNATAFVDGDRTLTYAELAGAAGLVAHGLVSCGVTAEEPVGVCLERGLDLPAAALGVWKAGGAYLPLDPEIPADRLHLMLADAGARVVVTTAALRHLVPPGVVALTVDDLHGSAEVSVPCPGRDALAAVIYTSGSTGRPKGVAVTGRSLVNRIDWFATECPPRPGDVGVLKTPIGFVDSLWELLGGLLHGVPTVVVPTDAGRDPRALVRILGEHGVTRMVLVPSLLRMLLTVDDLAGRLPALRLWVSSGEPLPADLARRFTARMPDRRLHNLYGSAEAWDTVWPTAFTGSGSDGSVPVGRPIANVSALVLDRAGHPAPVGVTGDLYVGGDCLARGYLNRPDLTAARFVPHPTEPGARLYRTGDLARYLPDGQLDIVGRVDHQLKIRGYRVEPGEVERALESLPAVGQAAVVGWRPSTLDALELAAYVVPSNGRVPDGGELRTALATRLPAHLVPTTVTVLTTMPTTATGKVDRTALPAPTRTAAGTGGGPTTTGERALAQLWAELLDVPSVGVDDDFFDIGGHSLIAARMVDRLGRMLDREVPVRVVFDHSTVRRMSKFFEEDE